MAMADGGQVVLLVGGGGLVVAEMQGNGDTTYSCAVENIAKLAQFSRLSGVGQTQHVCTRFGYIISISVVPLLRSTSTSTYLARHSPPPLLLLAQLRRRWYLLLFRRGMDYCT